MMYGIDNGKLSLAAWRMLFLIFSGLTIGCDILFVVFMPRNTTDACFLNDRGRDHFQACSAIVTRWKGARASVSSFDVAMLD